MFVTIMILERRNERRNENEEDLEKTYGSGAGSYYASGRPACTGSKFLPCETKLRLFIILARVSTMRLPLDSLWRETSHPHLKI